MSAKSIIELYIVSTGGSQDREPDPSDPAAVFKRQLVKGKPYKKDDLVDYAARDLHANQSTDNSWVSSAMNPWL